MKGNGKHRNRNGFGSISKIVSAALVIAMLSGVQAFAGKGTIHPGGGHTYKAVRLTPVIYNNANRDLSDLLILDENGTAIPYFINNVQTVQVNVNQAYPLVYEDSFVKDGDTYADYFIEGSEERDILSTSVSVRTQAGLFAKHVELRGSYDGVNWDYIQSDTLYRVDGSEKLRITFTKPLKYTHFRFRIMENAERVMFEGATLEYDQVSVERGMFVETLKPEFETHEDGKTTVIRLYGLKNVRINEITLETGSQFKRMVYFAGGSKTLYNLTFQNARYHDTTLTPAETATSGYTERGDVLELRVQNGDDAPIVIDGVTVRYYADELIFKSEPSSGSRPSISGEPSGGNAPSVSGRLGGRTYTLLFGDESITAAPEYDIANYKQYILSEGYDLLAVEDIIIETASVEEEAKTFDYSMAFNIVIVATALLLGFIILLRLKRVNG